jgi:hypothetical protein
MKSIRKVNNELRKSFHDRRCIVCSRRGIESHKIGWFTFCEKYPSVMNQLLSRGWKFENQFGVIKLTRGVENESNEVGL